MKTPFSIGVLHLQIVIITRNNVSAAGVLGQQPVQQEQAEGDEDDYLGDGDVRRVLAPHPGQDMQLMPSFIIYNIANHCIVMFTCVCR